MKTVFVTRRIPDVGLKMLTDKGYVVDVYPKDKVPSQRELIKYLRKKPYDAVLSLLTDQIDAAFMSAVPQAKVISNYAVGFNNIDVKEASLRGISVTNTAGASSDCVAEHTIALILALTTRLVEGDRFMRKGKYKGWMPMGFLGSDLSGATVGLIGAGHIGARVAHHAKNGFGTKVVYYDVVRCEELEKNYGAEYRSTIEEVLKEADIVSLHVPLLPTTHHLINAERLKLMKPTAYLVNTSRGPVVDEIALVEALQNRTIRAAALDVFEFEPKLARGLAKLDNVVLTPHIASARESARNQMAVLAAQNIIDVMEGRTPKGLVRDLSQKAPEQNTQQKEKEETLVTAK